MNSNNMTAYLLNQLKDSIPPPPASWRPLPWGYQVVIGLIFAIILAIIVVLIIRYKKRAVKREALFRLKQIYNNQNINCFEKVLGYDKLLRRIILTCFNRQDVAALTDKAWLIFLDVFLPEKQQNFINLYDIWVYALYKSQKDIPTNIEAIQKEQTENYYIQTKYWIESILPLTKSKYANILLFIQIKNGDN